MNDKNKFMLVFCFRVLLLLLLQHSNGVGSRFRGVLRFLVAAIHIRLAHLNRLTIIYLGLFFCCHDFKVFISKVLKLRDLILAYVFS